jgi:protease-4
MKNFFKITLASTLGVFIAAIFLYFISLVIFAAIIFAAGSGQSPKAINGATVLKIELTGSVSDRITETPFDFINKSSFKNYALNDLLTAIRTAGDNDKIKGIYLNVGNLSAGYASAEQIRRELLSFRAKGKFIVAYGEMISQNAYFIASVADRIFLNPEGIIDLHGLSANIQFEKGFYKNLGVEFQVFKVGTFKAAVEPYTLDRMSEPNRRQMTSLLDDIWGSLTAGIAESRSIPVRELNRLVDEGIIFADQKSLVENRLIDELRFADEAEKYVMEQLGQKTGETLRTASVYDVKNTESITKSGKDKIAILYAGGVIVDEAMPVLFGSENRITAKEYLKEIEKLRKDENIKAVVFRVNSPGGSAFASEQIHHAVRALNAEKPVVVSMGNVAASGGYYISAAARKIIAEPTTITGSIGIFGLIPNGRQLADKLGLTHDGVKTNNFADFGTQILTLPLLDIPVLPARPFNDGETKILQAYIERGYDTFLARCAEGRGKTKEEINEIGQGRVWSGNQALDNGLVDRLGGIDDAINEAAALAGITDYSIPEYPVQKSMFEQLLNISLDETTNSIAGILTGKEAYRRKALLKEWTRFDIRQAILPVEIK